MRYFAIHTRTIKQTKNDSLPKNKPQKKRKLQTV